MTFYMAKFENIHNISAASANLMVGTTSTDILRVTACSSDNIYRSTVVLAGKHSALSCRYLNA